MITRAKAAGAGLVVVTVLVGTIWLLWDAPETGWDSDLGTAGRDATHGMVLPEGRDLPGRRETAAETALVVPEPVIVGEPSAADEAHGPAIYIGSVQDPDGKPLEGVRVSLHVKNQQQGRARDPERPKPPALVSATSDAEGTFRMELPAQPEETLYVQAEAEGYSTLTVSPAVPEHAWALQLNWVVHVFGHVLDAASGAPLSGVTVSGASESSLTDTAGAYSLERVMVGAQLQLRAKHDDYATTEVEFMPRDREPAQVDLELRRGVLVRILVRDRETLEPLSGVQVGEGRRGKPFIETDVNGEFPLRVGEGDDISLMASLADHASLYVSWNVKQADPAHVPMLSLQRYAWIEGMVRDTAGEPLPDTGFYAYSGSKPGFNHWSEDQKREHGLTGFASDEEQDEEVLADAEGRFRLPVVPAPQPYVVTAYSESHASAKSEPVLLRAGGDQAWVEMVCELGATIRGQVRFNGEPWSGRLRCTRPDGTFVSWGHVTEQGTYELLRLAPGDVVIELEESSDPPQRAQLSVEPGAEYTQDFDWAGEVATISGTVLWSSGEPAAGAQVSANGEGPAGHSYAQADEDGRFAFEVEPGAIYTVSSQSIRGNPTRVIGLSVNRHYVSGYIKGVVAGAEGAEGVEIVLTVPGELSLALVDAGSGDPLRIADDHENRPWLSWRALGEDRFQPVRRARVEPDGTANVMLPLGDVELSIHLEDEGWLPRTVQGLVVRETENPAPEVVELRAGLDVTLQLVADPAGLGSRPEGCLLFALAEHELPLIRGPYSQEAGLHSIRLNGVCIWMGDPGLRINRLRVDERGIAELRGLAPGRYTLRAFGPLDVVFDPPTFEVPQSAGAPVEVQWSVAGG